MSDPTNPDANQHPLEELEEAGAVEAWDDPGTDQSPQTDLPTEPKEQGLDVPPGADVPPPSSDKV